MTATRQDEFLNLPFEAKLEFLYGLPARQKLDLILSAPEAERLVQSFSPETLFYTLKEIGISDSGDLLGLAVPEQIKGLFDLDCWERDRPNLNRMREWIEAMGEAGRIRLADGLMELDTEMMALLLREYFRVHRLDDPQSLDDVPYDRYIQLDEHYLIEFARHDAILPYLVDFLEEVFERDYTYFTALMEEVYWGVEAELEEEAYQSRRSRLSDRGFPDFFEAQNVFAYLDPSRFADIRATYEPPSRADQLRDGEAVAPDFAPAIPNSDNSLFNTALTAGFAAQGQRQLRSEMALVSNQVLVARAVDFGDLDAVRIAVEMTHDYLNLGLEHLAGGDLTNAIEHLRATHLTLLFRLGVSLTVDLRTRAQEMVAELGLDPAKTRRIAYLDSPYGEALAGFLERQPRFYGGLDSNGTPVSRTFRSMRDLRLAYAILEQIRTMRALFRELFNVDIAAAAFRGHVAGREVRLGQILLTAFVREALDQSLSPVPIQPAQLGAMYAAVMSEGGRPARLAEAFRARIDELLAHRLGEETRNRSRDFVNACLNVLEDELAELDPKSQIDPRFILSVLIGRDASPNANDGPHS